MMHSMRLAISVLGILLIGTAHAASVPVLSVSGGIDQNNGLGFSLGWEFTVNQAVTVTELGFYDDLGNGLTNSHAVGIYNSGGTLLTSGTVSPSDALDGLFRYTNVADIVLTPGNTYYMMAVTGTIDKYKSIDANNPGTLTMDPSVNWIRNAYRSPPGGVLASPNFFNTPAGVIGYFGGNFKIEQTVVPVPAAAWLFSGALGALGWIRRRQQVSA